MQINKINYGIGHKANYIKSIEISSASNKNRSLLFNEILDVSRKYKVPGVYKANTISLTSVPEEAFKKIKELGIILDSVK